MNKQRLIVLPALLVSLYSLSMAANPEIVGTYTGSVKSNSYNSSGAKSKVKSTMELTIAADDSSTLTLGSIVLPNYGQVFSDVNGFIIYSGAASYRSLSLQFKNGTAKGTIHGVDGATPETVTYLDGKFKLKKTTP